MRLNCQLGIEFVHTTKLGNEKSPSRVLHKTLKLIISRYCFAHNGKEMCQRECMRHVHIVLWRFHCPRRRGFLKSLLRIKPTIQQNTMQLQLDTIRQVTIRYDVIQCNAMLYHAIQSNPMPCHAMPYHTVQCNTLQ